MQELSLGEYIKRERLRQGITQEQLCEGICEPITISRMENGKQTPSYERIRAFLHRLGLPDDRYFALLSPTEMEIRTLQNEIRADMIRFYRAMPEDKPVIRSEGLKKLKKLEDLAGSDERIIRQYIFERLSDGPYLELFARRRQSGWDCWGNEVPGGSDIVIPGYPVPSYSEKITKPDKRKEV